MEQQHRFPSASAHYIALQGTSPIRVHAKCYTRMHVAAADEEQRCDEN
jgi:hypothetical protein